MLEVDSQSSLENYNFKQSKMSYEWLVAGIKKYGSSAEFYKQMVEQGILKPIEGFEFQVSSDS